MYPSTDDVKRHALLDDMVVSLRADPTAPTGPNGQGSAEFMDLTQNFKRANLPPPPQTGLTLFPYEDTGRVGLGVMDTGGMPLRPQPHLGENFVYIVSAQDNSTTLFTQCCSVVTTGTATAKTVDPSFNVYSARTRRIGYHSSTLAGSAAGLTVNYASLFRGLSTDEGGFYVHMRFGIAGMTTTASNSRIWFGLRASTAAPANVDFSTGTGTASDGLWFGSINGDTSLFMWHNGAAATPTKVTTNLPRPIVDDVFDVKFFCQQGGTQIFSSVRNLRTGGYFEYNSGASTNLPGARTMMAPFISVTNNATAELVAIDFHQMYIEVRSL